MIEVLKQMVEALEWCHGGEPVGTADAIQAGRQAIAKLESQEPVGWVQDVEFEQLPEFAFSWVKTKLHDKPLFTHPPQRTEREPDVVMHWHSHTWTTINPPPKNSGDVNLYYAPPQRTEERNFCPRCGKRTNDIHTCTPPQENT